MYRLPFFIFLSFILFCDTTCKKIDKDPFNMYGVWVSNEGFCGSMFVEIKRNGQGTYGTASGNIGCDGKKWSGTVRFNNTHLYVGHTKMTFLKKPTAYTAGRGDSLGWYGDEKLHKITAKMSVQMSIFHNHDSYTFNKIIDY